MATKIFSEEQLNYFRVCHIAIDILPEALRFLFKQEWDNRYKTTFGEWKDTPQNGLDLNNGESPANQRRNARLLATMVNGDRAQWDCTMLFYAILFSDSIHGLSPLIKSNVDDLRKIRNEDFAHMTREKKIGIMSPVYVLNKNALTSVCLASLEPGDGGRGRGTELIFAGYVPLASPSPFPIIGLFFGQLQTPI